MAEIKINENFAEFLGDNLNDYLESKSKILNNLKNIFLQAGIDIFNNLEKSKTPQEILDKTVEEIKKLIDEKILKLEDGTSTKEINQILERFSFFEELYGPPEDEIVNIDSKFKAEINLGKYFQSKIKNEEVMADISRLLIYISNAVFNALKQEKNNYL